MISEFEEAVGNDIIKPAKMLRLEKDEEEKFEKGRIFEKSPEILVPCILCWETSEIDDKSRVFEVQFQERGKNQ